MTSDSYTYTVEVGTEKAPLEFSNNDRARLYISGVRFVLDNLSHYSDIPTTLVTHEHTVDPDTDRYEIKEIIRERVY